MAASSLSPRQASSTIRPLHGAALKWQQAMLARLPSEIVRLIRLQTTMDHGTWTTIRKSVITELDRLRDSRTSHSEGSITEAMFMQEEARLTARLAEIDAQQATVEERQALQDARPAGCVCLGVGGVGSLIAVLSDGLAIFERYCECEDGERAREAAAWANEAVQVQEEDTRRLHEQLQRQHRSRDILTRAGIDRRYEMCTFASLHALLRRRGLLTDENAYAIQTRALAYAEGEPLRGDFIYGEPGHGKTSLGISALRAWVERGRVGRFISEGDFLDRLHASMSRHDGEGETLLEELKTTPLLVFDDLAMMTRTPFDRGKIVSLLVARHAANALTVLTSNFSIRDVALRLSGDDRLEHGRLEGRLREMCDELRLITGELRTPHRSDVPAPSHS
jgi:DNA replication protein DnaC